MSHCRSSGGIWHEQQEIAGPALAELCTRQRLEAMGWVRDDNPFRCDAAMVFSFHESVGLDASRISGVGFKLSVTTCGQRKQAALPSWCHHRHSAWMALSNSACHAGTSLLIEVLQMDICRYKTRSTDVANGVARGEKGGGDMAVAG